MIKRGGKRGGKKWGQPKRSLDEVKDSVKETVKDKLNLAEEAVTEAERITNKTVEEVREEVLSGARRFVYPLQHSRHRVVIISSAIIVALILSLLVSAGAMLYKFRSTSDFAYRISQVVPFPIARINGHFVAYEDYLFEVRGLIHYYRTHPQEGVDIDSREGEKLLKSVKRQAFEKVKMQAIVEQLADKYEVSVTNDEIDEVIAPIKAKVGADQDSGESLDKILADYYGWNEHDLRRVMRNQLLRQKLLPKIDTKNREQAEFVLKRVKAGVNFAKLAKQYSEDPLTKTKGGVVGSISRSETGLPSAFVDAAFALKPGKTSDIIETTFGLHIIKNLRQKGDKIQVAHILLRYFDLDEYLRKQLDKASVNTYARI